MQLSLKSINSESYLSSELKKHFSMLAKLSKMGVSLARQIEQSTKKRRDQKTKNKAYSMKKVSFEENKTFDKRKVENFIKFNASINIV